MLLLITLCCLCLSQYEVTCYATQLSEAHPVFPSFLPFQLLGLQARASAEALSPQRPLQFLQHLGSMPVHPALSIPVPEGCLLTAGLFPGHLQTPFQVQSAIKLQQILE